MTDPSSFDVLIGASHVVVVAGSGGVGKTTTSAAIAVRAAMQGRRVAVVTIDPAKREALYREAEIMARPDLPIIPLHFQVNGFAVRKGLVLHTRMQEGIRAWDVVPQ